MHLACNELESFLNQNNQNYILTICSSSNFGYGQTDNKKYGDESTSIYSQHFSPEYAFILENSDNLEAQFKKQPAHLERLYGKYCNNTLLI